MSKDKEKSVKINKEILKATEYIIKASGGTIKESQAVEMMIRGFSKLIKKDAKLARELMFSFEDE